jgi:hypothetical protein
MQGSENSNFQQSAATRITPQQIEKIVDENGEEYRRDIFKSTWKMRVQGLWTGGALGIFFGGGIGALTALSPLLIGASLATVGALIVPVTAAFAVFGMVAGVAAMSSVGLSTGSMVGGEKIADRKRMLDTPTPEMAGAARYQSTANEKGTTWNRIIPFTKGSKRIFDWKAGLIFTAAGLAVGGLLVASGGAGVLAAAMPGITTALTSAHIILSATAMTGLINCMTVTTMGLFGAFFGVDIATIGANMMEFVSNVFSGKIFESKKERAAEVSKTIELSKSEPRSSQVSASVVFGSTSSTLISPIGAYAGQKPAKHLRQLAEQRFNKMQLSRETTIN